MFKEILSDLWQIAKDALDTFVPVGSLFCLIPLLCMVICIIVRKERFEEKIAHQIALWNSVGVTIALSLLLLIAYQLLNFTYILFGLTAYVLPLICPALFYYWINRILLTKRKKDCSGKNFNSNDCADAVATSIEDAKGGK